MTAIEADAGLPLPRLGAGAVLRRMLGLCAARPISVTAAALPAAVAVWLLTRAIAGDGGGATARYLLLFVAMNAVFGLGMTAVTATLVGWRLPGGPTAIFAAVPPVLVLYTFAGIACTLALVLLVLPGLYLSALWSVLVPAILLDGTGFRALGRSARMTRGYRWPLAGLWAIILAPQYAVGAAVTALEPPGAAAASLEVAINVALLVFSGALALAIHERLTVLGRGDGRSALAEVFA